MPDRTVLLFPSQGAYLPGALARLTADYPTARDIVDAVDGTAREFTCGTSADTLLDPDAPGLASLLSDDPDALQLAIFATSLALHAVYRGSFGARFDVFTGHSVGEVAALTAAGAFTVADGARIVVERSRAMRELGPAGGLVTVNLSAERTAHLLGTLAEDDLEVAAVNGPRQTVVSGTDTALDLLRRALTAFGVQHVTVPSPFLSHNRLLVHVERHLAEVLADIPVSPLQNRVYSPVHSRFYRDGDDLTRLLAEQITRPVDFLGAIRRLQARGCDIFVECGARDILTGLVRGGIGRATVLAPLERVGEAAEFAQIAGAVPGAHRNREQPASADPEQPRPSSGHTTAAEEPAAEPALPDRAELLVQLRRMYADAIEAPEDLVGLDMDLESELGVDSLTQLQLLTAAASRFGRAQPPEGLRVSEYTTLTELADLLQRLGPS